MTVGATIAVLLGLGGCTPTETEDTSAANTTTTRIETETNLPPEIVKQVEGADWKTIFEEVLVHTIETNFRTPWGTQQTMLDLGGPTCPDWYVGNPAPDSINELAVTQGGVTWYDYCREDLTTFGGFSNVQVDVASNQYSDGSYEDNASRTLITDAAVSVNNEISWSMDGTGTDSIYINRDSKGTVSRWIYSSTQNANLSGDQMFPDKESAYQGGYRTDLYLFTTGGDSDLFETRGNVLYKDYRIQGWFDSFEVDLSLQGTKGAGPDTCLSEPLGWMGVRDDSAYWYDLVFLPRYDNNITDTGYDNPYTKCDGCGTLYVRGANFSEAVAQVCPDFSIIWPLLNHPTVDDFIWSNRDL